MKRSVFYFTLGCMYLCFTALKAESWDYKKSSPQEDIAPQTPSIQTPDSTGQKKIISQEHIPSSAMQKKPSISMLSIPVLARNLRIGDLIVQDDIIYKQFPAHQISTHHAMDAMQIVGQQLRRSIPKLKPIFLETIGNMITVKRNQEVQIVFQKGTMILTTIGRSLEQGGIGDRIKVMNNESKKIVTGRINKEGNIDVTL